MATKRFEDRTAATSRADRVQEEQAAVVAKAAADAREATQLSTEVFEIRSRIRYACEEYPAKSAIAREPWLGPDCVNGYLQAITALDVAIGKLAYRVDELPVDRVTVDDMRKLSEAYWGIPGGTTSLRQELVVALHKPPNGNGIGLKYCGPLISATPDRPAKCAAQLVVLQGIVDRIGQISNVVFCGLSHDLAELRARVYEIASPGGAEPTVSSLLARRLRENADSNVCSFILARAHGTATHRHDR